MPLIANANYETRRIFLSIDSVGLPSIDPIDIYKEYRGRRQLNTDGGQNYDPLISAFGNSSVGGGERTAEYTDLATGVKIVPFDAEQIITINGFLVSRADELQGRDLFDRSPILSSVDIDYFPPATKIVTVPTGGALTAEQSQQLANLAATLQSAGVFSAAALAAAPSGTGGDATEANQTAIIDAIAAIQGIGFDTTLHSLVRILAFLKADEIPGSDRYQKLDETTREILLDKDVLRDSDGAITELRRHFS